MKNIKSLFSGILLLLFLSAQLNAEELKWFDFKNGKAKAEKEGKILLVDFYTDWCGWCKKMDADTYGVKEVIDFLNKNFVAVKLNPEKAGAVNIQDRDLSNAEFAQAAGVSGYPATSFFTSKMEFIRTFPGYMDSEKFLDLLKYLVENVKS